MASNPPDDDTSVSEARTPQSVSLRTIFNVVKAIIEAGPDTEAAFLELCDRTKHKIVIEAEVINLVKHFLLQQEVHRRTGLEAMRRSTREIIVSPNGRCP